MHMVGCGPIGRQTAALAPAFGGHLICREKERLHERDLVRADLSSIIVSPG
jgi:phosphoglycerate dehydrogenase-like enzyme